MKSTEKNRKLKFHLHLLTMNIEQLKWSLIYNDYNEENPQHYLKELIKQINEINLNEFKNQ